MVVQTSVDGESLFQKVKCRLDLQYQCLQCLENISNSVRTAATAVHATNANTHAELEITNRDFGTWAFDITGHAGTANISVELTGDDPADIIKAINNANIGITASQSTTNPKKIKLDSSQQGIIEIKKS